MLKNPRRILLLIVLLTIAAVFLDLPKFKIRNIEISHPKINTKLVKRDLEPKLGLDLAGGVQLTMSADMQNIDPQDRDAALASAKDIVENRIDSLGVAEPVIQTAKTQAQYRLIIEIPGISDIDQAVATVKKTAHLEFKILKKDSSAEATYAAKPEDFEASGLTGKDLKRAAAAPSQDPGTPGYVVNLTFNQDGAKKLEVITADNLEKPMAMYLDDQPISWPPPVIKAVITDGNAQITVAPSQSAVSFCFII